MNARRRFLSALIAALAVSGCGLPSEDRRQNRRLVDAALTAVTIKNPKELEKCRKLLDERRSASRLSRENHAKIILMLDKAVAGQWAESENDFYKFRESQPFPD